MNNKNVVIWGCGGYSKQVINRDNIPYENVAYFCDSDREKWGTMFLGKLVISPMELNDSCNTIVISSELYFEEIRQSAITMYPDKNIISIEDYEKSFVKKENRGERWGGKSIGYLLNEAGVIHNELLENSKLCNDRRLPLYQLAKKGGCVGEVGVAYGDFTLELLNILKPSKFYAIDYFNKDNPYINFYGRTDFQDTKMTHEEWYKHKFKKDIVEGKMEVLSGLSWECLEEVDDDTFDYLYIDAAHDYASVKKDIAVAIKKVKNKGIIQFNDYTIWDLYCCSYYGVVPVVNEMINKTRSKVLYFCLAQNFHDIVIELNKSGETD